MILDCAKYSPNSSIVRSEILEITSIGSVSSEMFVRPDLNNTIAPLINGVNSSFQLISLSIEIY